MPKGLNTKHLKLFFVLLIGLIAWQLPEPEGLSLQGWHLVILFVLTITTVILDHFPMGVVAFMAMCIGCFTHLFNIQECLDVYGKPIVWLIVFSFLTLTAFLLPT